VSLTNSNQFTINFMSLVQINLMQVHGTSLRQAIAYCITTIVIMHMSGSWRIALLVFLLNVPFQMHSIIYPHGRAVTSQKNLSNVP
jgi:hypothetical protein